MARLFPTTIPQRLKSLNMLRGAEKIVRPIGSLEFIHGLEVKYDRKLQPQKRGPKV